MKLFTAENVTIWKNLDTGKDMHSLSTGGNEDLVYCPLEWQKQGLSQTASGYGQKLTQPYKINYEGKLYRLYTTCFSNVGSTWFVTKGKKIFVS